jgi:cell wall-associated NlpC family hydrolase
MSQFLAAAHQLSGAQQLASRTKQAKAALKAKLASQKNTLQKLISQEQTLLNQLTPAQQQAVGPGGGVPTGPMPKPGPTGGQKPPPVSGAAGKAVDFAFAQLGCPYVFGGTGPCPNGFDCSGLTQAAWAAAGVSIPRTSEEQWAGLTHIPEADIQPGDILEFNGLGHVALYIGGGMLIDALHSGVPVEKVPFSGWYTQTFDGALRV